MVQKRRAPRFECSARISGAGSAAMLVRGHVRDVSPTGLCLVTTMPVRKGQTLHLSFHLPTGLVEAVGEIRWLLKKKGKPHELGIRFVRIATTATRVINAAIIADQLVLQPAQEAAAV